MALADARARYPSLRVIDSDPARDNELLNQIAEFCERYTPLVAPVPPRELVLDISGCCHLFNGETGLAADLQKRLRTAGLTTRITIASTTGCALAMAGSIARKDGAITIIPRGEERAFLSALPLQALRLPPETVSLLETFGLRRIDALYDQPRAPLTARFGPAVMQRLDQALGHEEEPISPLTPVQPYIAEQRFSEPVGRDTDILGTIEQLCEQLARMMEKRQEGGRCFIADLFRVDGAIRRLIVSTGKPMRDARIIRRLFSERLAGIQDFDPGFGFDLIRLSAGNNNGLAGSQTSLDESENKAADTDTLIDRLGIRFGKSAALYLEQQDRHRPEYATIARTASGQSPEKKQDHALPYQDSQNPLRPVRLFEHPEPIDALAEVPDGPPLRFRWRRLTHDVSAAEGPERIAPEWWLPKQGSALTRDYFRVETREGIRLWLFREGLYEREVRHPGWFIHGFFA